MIYKTATFYSFCLFSLAFVIACGAQNDSLSTDEALAQQLIDDPLTQQIKTNHQQQTDLIMYNRLDMESLGEILNNTPGNDPCKVKDDISQIAHADEYFANMCRQIQLNLAINEKYPMIKDLDSDTRIKIFYSSEPLTTEEIFTIIEI